MKIYLVTFKQQWHTEFVKQIGSTKVFFTKWGLDHFRKKYLKILKESKITYDSGYFITVYDKNPYRIEVEEIDIWRNVLFD